MNLLKTILSVWVSCAAALDYMHDNRYDDYDSSIPKIFVETYKTAYRKGYDVEHMAAQF